MKEFIQNKKDAIISKFLKGYSHQESILKTFESKIKGHFLNLPNLIFKKCNRDGKTIEEINQIYLTKIEGQKLIISDFNYFYFVKYLNGTEKDKKIFPNGFKFEIVNNHLYFLEIKQSIKGLKSVYKKEDYKSITTTSNKGSGKNSKNSKDSYISSKFKRDELTDLGNAFLSFKIFRDLILYIMGENENECNLLYIVDSDFEENMIKTFEDCLNRDKKVIEELKLSFNLYLIYTQPDLTLRHFIKESWEKKDEIKSLINRLDKKEEEIKKKTEEIKKQNKEIEDKNKKIEDKNKELEKMKFEMKIEKIQNMAISLDESIIDFIKKKINKEYSLVLIGLFEYIKDNPIYFCDSLNYYHKKNQNDKVTLVDFRTFNKVDLNDSDDSNNELFCKCIIDDYKNNMKKFNFFDEIYLMVDLIFLKNISLFKILEKYDIYIYMKKNDTFIMHLKKDNTKFEIITIKNEESSNPLFGKSGDSETLTLFEIEQFANNFMNLLGLRQFIKKTSYNLKKKGYLFDFKGRINYILEFCKKVDNNNESNDSCLVQITNVRDVNNYLIDKYPEKYIKDKNIIFVRETEFGKSFTKEELFSILTYNFNIDISEFKNRIIEKHDDKNVIIYKTVLEEEKVLARLIKYKSILPIFLMNDKKINNKCIQLIEYLYFLFLPLLIQEKSKPKVLIISDDYGILYNYYKSYI